MVAPQTGQGELAGDGEGSVATCIRAKSSDFRIPELYITGRRGARRVFAWIAKTAPLAHQERAHARRDGGVLAPQAV